MCVCYVFVIVCVYVFACVTSENVTY